MSVALLSVYHKEGIDAFARQLVSLGWDILASGGTARHLKGHDIPVLDVASLVGGKAILGHRVVTLSREIHAGLLARLPQDQEEMGELGLPLIDLVCVDLYPLRDEIAKPDSTLDSVIDMTDIGGPTMLRAAAKGNRVVVCDPGDRQTVIDWLKAEQPDRQSFINSLAAKAEFVAAQYALDSARYRGDDAFEGIVGQRVSLCGYGENPQQAPAAVYKTGSDDPLALDKFELSAGVAPSYNNWRDIHRLLQTLTHIAAAFDVNRGRVPLIAVGCKHGNPCGAAFGDDPTRVLESMIAGDPQALFGGLVMTNFPILDDQAEALLHTSSARRRIYDGLIAPDFTSAALEKLTRRGDKCRMLQNHALGTLSRASLDTSPMFVQVRGGFMVQPNYTFVLDLKDTELDMSGALEPHQEANLLLAWAVGATSNSNTVTLVKNSMLIGNGVGQQDRVGAASLALTKAKRSQHDTKGAVAYSDSFFPFDDGPKLLFGGGISAILASSGSVNDQQVRDFCAQRHMALWLIPDIEGRGFFGH